MTWTFSTKIAVLLVLAGCGRETPRYTNSDGTLDNMCHPDGTCDFGLECRKYHPGFPIHLCCLPGDPTPSVQNGTFR